MFSTKKVLIILCFISFHVVSEDEYQSNGEGFVFENLNIKEFALFQCATQNYLAAGVYMKKEGENPFNDVSGINREYSIDNVIKVINFTEKETAKYHEVSLNMKHGNDTNMIFSLCINFYKSKKLDDFIKKLK